MAASNRDRVRKGLDLLKAGLTPYVEREMQAVHGPSWRTLIVDDRRRGPSGSNDLDTAGLLATVWEQWHAVFSRKLGPFERGVIGELRGIRNKWAHEEPFTTEDTYRALDNVCRLLQAAAAPTQAAEAERERQELLRTRFDEQARMVSRRAAVGAVEGQPSGGLKPWREVVTPHPDVASGRYQQAEFAADLGQVHRGEGGDEYATRPSSSAAPS